MGTDPEESSQTEEESTPFLPQPPARASESDPQHPGPPEPGGLLGCCLPPRGHGRPSRPSSPSVPTRPASEPSAAAVNKGGRSGPKPGPAAGRLSGSLARNGGPIPTCRQRLQRRGPAEPRQPPHVAHLDRHGRNKQAHGTAQPVAVPLPPSFIATAAVSAPPRRLAAAPGLAPPARPLRTGPRLRSRFALGSLEYRRRLRSGGVGPRGCARSSPKRSVRRPGTEGRLPVSVAIARPVGPAVPRLLF